MYLYPFFIKLFWRILDLCIVKDMQKVQFKQYNEGEILLFPNCLDLTIGENHLVRIINHTVNRLDLGSLIFTYSVVVPRPTIPVCFSKSFCIPIVLNSIPVERLPMSLVPISFLCGFQANNIPISAPSRISAAAVWKIASIMYSNLCFFSCLMKVISV